VNGISLINCDHAPVRETVLPGLDGFPPLTPIFPPLTPDFPPLTGFCLAEKQKYAKWLLYPAWLSN
jgi:hypothetical protein